MRPDQHVQAAVNDLDGVLRGQGNPVEATGRSRTPVPSCVGGARGPDHPTALFYARLTLPRCYRTRVATSSGPAVALPGDGGARGTTRGRPPGHTDLGQQPGYLWYGYPGTTHPGRRVPYEWSRVHG